MVSFKIKYVFKNLKCLLLLVCLKITIDMKKTKQNTININSNLSPPFWYLFNCLVGIKEKWEIRFKILSEVIVHWFYNDVCFLKYNFRFSYLLSSFGRVKIN